MATLLPPPAGPKTVRELFHYLWKHLTGVVTVTNTHIIDNTNPHNVTHAQLPDVSPNQHHNQAHLLLGADHTDVLAGTAALRDGLFWNGTKFSLDKRMNYIYGGFVNGTTYQPDDVLQDNGWLSIAKVVTTQRPEPIPLGPTQWLVDELAPGWTISNIVANNVATGHDMVPTVDFIVTDLRIYIPIADPNVWYRAIYKVFTDVNFPTVVLTEWAQALAVGWRDYPIDPKISKANVKIQVVMQSENRAGLSTSTVGYNYSSDNTDIAIPSGVAHRRMNRTYVDFSKTPAIGIMNIPPVSGSQITAAGGVDWNVGSVVDNGTWWRLEITGPGNPADGLVTFTFNTPSATANQYFYNNPNYWNTHSTPNGTVQGIYAPDGFATYNQNGYGVNLKGTPVILATDWEVLTDPLTGSGGGTVTGGSFTPTVFLGPGTTGYVKDSLSISGRFLGDDGNFNYQNHRVDGGNSASYTWIGDGVVNGGNSAP